jgi:hypothetical protein
MGLLSMGTRPKYLRSQRVWVLSDGKKGGPRIEVHCLARNWNNRGRAEWALSIGGWDCELDRERAQNLFEEFGLVDIHGRAVEG